MLRFIVGEIIGGVLGLVGSALRAAGAKIVRCLTFART